MLISIYKTDIILRMRVINIKFVKTHNDAILPARNHDTDTGYDLFAVESVIIPARGSAIVPIGLTLGWITPGYWFRIEARSGLGFKHSVDPHFGVIDEPYRGDLGVKLYNKSDKYHVIEKGKCPAQIIIYERIEAALSFVSEVIPTERGAQGFNSSNR